MHDIFFIGVHMKRQIYFFAKKELFKNPILGKILRSFGTISVNRGGADLLVKVYMADENEGLSTEDVPVTMDGITRMVPAGSIVRVKPGESITMQRYLYHSFWADGGIAVVGEVSMCNDDANDNRFYEPQGRFPTIEEDEPPLYLLCHEYPAARD
jgi:D-lyxose ketol-isomerase